MKKILCLGSITMDLVMNVPRFVRPGETLLTDNFSMAPGGKGSNQAATVAKLGGVVRYFTLLGGDSNSRFLTEHMSKIGVDMSRVLYRPELTAGVAMGQVDASGQNCWVYYPGSSLAMTADDIRLNEDVFDGFDILLISAELSRPAVAAALEIAKSRNMTVIMDPSPLSADDIPDDIFDRVDFLKPNETEAKMITGISVDSQESKRSALEALADLGVRTPFISLGGEGVIALVDGKYLHIEAVSVPVCDTTAAGDVFIGAFARQFSEGLDVEACLSFACHAAALSVSRPGAQTSIPSFTEVTDFMKERSEMP
jgi:ribokinase